MSKKSHQFCLASDQIGIIVVSISRFQSCPGSKEPLFRFVIYQSSQALDMSTTASALQLPNEGDRVQMNGLSNSNGTHNQHDEQERDSARADKMGQHGIIDISTSQDIPVQSPQPNSLASLMTSNFTLSTPPASPGAAYPPPLQLEYSSSAPMPQTQRTHTVQSGDPAVPSHLYERLPKHFLHREEGSEDLVPDYMRMILLCKFTCRVEMSNS